MPLRIHSGRTSSIAKAVANRILRSPHATLTNRFAGVADDAEADQADQHADQQDAAAVENGGLNAAAARDVDDRAAHEQDERQQRKAVVVIVLLALALGVLTAQLLGGLHDPDIDVVFRQQFREGGETLLTSIQREI